jgi:ketosteroid isomerase-like protein
MDTRGDIEAILDKLYDARRRNDASAAAACFREDGRFMSNGAPAAAKNRVDHLAALRGLFEAFVCAKLDVYCRIIDPPRAAVHWHGTFRAQNGKVGDTDVLDVIEFQDGRVVSLITFYDTAYAAALAAPA